MLWSTQASFRHVNSAMSSLLSNLGGFIFCMTSLSTSTRLPVSAISTSTSSPRSPLMPADTKPWLSWGTHTRRFWVHSACVGWSLSWLRSTARYFMNGSERSVSMSMATGVRRTRVRRPRARLKRYRCVVFKKEKKPKPKPVEIWSRTMSDPSKWKNVSRDYIKNIIYNRKCDLSVVVNSRRRTRPGCSNASVACAGSAVVAFVRRARYE